MGTTIHELRAIISMNLASFSQGARDVIDNTKGMRKAWSEFATDAATAGNRIITTMGVIGGAVAGAAAKMGFSFNSIKEQSEIAFTTMLGDGDKAKKMIADLTEFAARTPFELPNLLDSTKKLMAFGFEAEKIIPMLTVVGDAASGLGNPAAMDFIIRAIGQIQAKGKVAAQEMNQLAEQGIPAWETLASTIGVSIPEAMKLAEEGAISSQVAIPAILSGMDARFHGMMEKQSQSMSGLFSTLMDRMRAWAGDAFKPVYDSIRKGLGKLLSGEGLGQIDKLVKVIKSSMASVAKEIDAIFAADPTAFFAAIGEVIGKTTQVFAALIKWLRQSGPEFTAVAKAVWGFIEPLMQYLIAHPQLLAALIAFRVTGLLGVNQALWSMGKAVAETIKFLIGFVARITATTAATAADTAVTTANTAAHTANAAAKNLSGGLGRRMPVGRAPVAPGNAFGRTVASSASIAAAEIGTTQVASNGLMATLTKIGGWFAGIGGVVARGLGSVGAWIAKLGAVGSSVTAVGAASAASWAAIAVGVGVVIYKTGELVGWLWKYQSAMKEGQKLNQEMLRITEARRQKEMEMAQGLEPKQKAAALEKQYERLRSELAAKQNRKEALDAEAKTRRSSDWGSSVMGNYAARDAEEESKGLKGEIDSGNKDLMELQKQLQEARREAAAAPPDASAQSPLVPPTQSPQSGDIFDIPQDQLDAIHGKGEAKAEGKRETKAQQEIEKFAALLDNAFGEIPDEEIEKMRTNFATLSQQFVDGSITSAEFKLKAKEMTDVIQEAGKVAERAEQAQESFNATIEQFAGQVPDDELEAWKTTFGNVREAFESGRISAAQFKEGQDIINNAINDSAQMQDRFIELRDSLGDQSVDGFVETFESLQDELRNGDITAQVYKSEMAALNEEMKRSVDAENARTTFLNQMGNLQDDLKAKKISLPDGVWNSFNDRFSALTQKFTTGAISAQQFARATDVLQREMDAAGNAAIKELQAKERARLLSGNFTQEEFKKAAEDRIIAMRMQQFDQYVERAVNGMMGLSNGFEQLQGGMQQFGNGMQQGFQNQMQNFDWGQWQAGNAQFSQFQQTVSGQVANIVNQIALAQDRLNLSSIVWGDAVSGADRWRTIEQIEDWMRQLVELQKAPPPQFVAGLGRFEFRDPGLQYGQGTVVENKFVIDAPNLTRFTNQDAENVAAALDRLSQSRGRSLYGN